MTRRALAVDASSRCRAVPAQTAAERRRWDEFVARSRDGSMRQCFWWADPLERYGVVSIAVGCWREEELIGGALLRAIPVPYTRFTITECLDGPLFVSWEPEWGEVFVEALAELADEARSVAVSVKGCPRADVLEDVVAALRRRGARLTTSAGVTDAVLPLGNRTPADVTSGFHKGTKRAVKKGREAPTHIRRVTTRDELRRAHAAWMATAARKEFDDVRPWDALEPVLRHAVDHDVGSVLATFRDDELLAAIFVTHMGTQGTYVYGGYLDGAEQYRPNHVLHLEAIELLLAAGVDAYNLGSLMGAGQFKLGFGAKAVKRLDTLTWERRPLLYGLLQHARGLRVGRTVEKLLRRRLVSRRGLAGSETEVAQSKRVVHMATAHTRTTLGYSSRNAARSSQRVMRSIS